MSASECTWKLPQAGGGVFRHFFYVGMVLSHKLHVVRILSWSSIMSKLSYTNIPHSAVTPVIYSPGFTPVSNSQLYSALIFLISASSGGPRTRLFIKSPWNWWELSMSARIMSEFISLLTVSAASLAEIYYWECKQVKLMLNPQIHSISRFPLSRVWMMSLSNIQEDGSSSDQLPNWLLRFLGRQTRDFVTRAVSYN